MASSTIAGQKRKADTQQGARHGGKRRKAEIPVQHGQSGELNIASFVKAREFEIKALESSMQKARKGLMARAFQQLPRNMRRRTASHNVKKIPRRLRKRAEREMKDDNTPTVSKRTRTPSRKLRLRLQTAKTLQTANKRSKTVRQRKREAKANAKEPDPENHVAVARVPRIKKNKLADPPKATSKYKRRQVNKTWLPTHLWHAKRARMTRPTEPLWRMAIPLSPTEKSYRPSHRAAGSRGCIAWDASYVSTVGCQGTEHTLENMLKALGFTGEGGSGPKHKRWVAGTRFAQGWAYEVDGEKQCLTPMTVIWINKASDDDNRDGHSTKDDADASNNRKRKVKLDRKLLVRVHPSAFRPFWTELLKAAKMQKPQVLIEDLRYEIGSIEINGPGSTEALSGVLKPRFDPQSNSIEELWCSLASLSSPASLPARCLLAFDIVDPRLSHPPKQESTPSGPESLQRLNELIVSWPPDSVASSSHLASYKHRWQASARLPSQKAIHRRKAEAGKGQALTVTDKDPAIPIMLLAQRSGGSGANSQGSWTLLLPWSCTDAVWRCLLHYLLTTGSNPRFGGLNETRQIAFEQMAPWFPGDFPGTNAGKAWERTEAEKRFDQWIRLPPSRRLAWDKLDLGLDRRGEIGNGWSCDWEYLLMQSQKAEPVPSIEPPPPVNDEAVQPDNDIPADAKKQPPQLPPMPGWIRKPRKQRKAARKASDERQRRRNTSSPEPEDEAEEPHKEILPEVEYLQLTPGQGGRILKRAIAALPEKPVLATIRIRLLSKGHPSPAARIYRLPAPTPPPVPAVPSELEQPQSNATATNSSADSAPAPGQPSADPVTSSASIFTTAAPSTDTGSLREKWLSLVPPDFYHSKSSLPTFTKQHHNHRGLPSKHTVHAYDPPDHINVLPKNAPQSIIDEFGPKPVSAEQKKRQEREALMAELMKGDFTPNDTWDASKGLVPCPDENDLIGFATSGGYNLSQGCGTAVAGLWIQRLLDGWNEEDVRAAKETASMTSKQKENYRKKHEKQKHLCIVRNAGESIGRLGVWELCE